MNDFQKEVIRNYRTQYSAAFRFFYNRIVDSNGKISEIELRNYRPSILNTNLLDSWFVQCSIYDAKALYKSRSEIETPVQRKKEKDKDYKRRIKKFEEERYSVVFGGKKLFESLSRLKQENGELFKERLNEFKEKRLKPLYIIGEGNYKGNRKIQLLYDEDLDKFSFLFKPTRSDHYVFDLEVPRCYHNLFIQLWKIQSTKKYAITYKVDDEYLHVSFDESLINGFKLKPIENRVIAIDMNPNYVGYSVVQWSSSSEYEIIDKGLFDLKDLNIPKRRKNRMTKHQRLARKNFKKKLTRRKDHELKEIARQLISIAIHYKCEVFAIEDLKFKPGDKKKGSFFNLLCNQTWNRNDLVESIQKWCNIFNIHFFKVYSSWSSMVGNYVFRGEHLPDPILSSIEIGRRGYEINAQKIGRNIKKKNIAFPMTEDFKDEHIKSMEEFNVSCFQSIEEAIKSLKKSGKMIRLSLEGFLIEFSRWRSQKNLVSFANQFNIKLIC